jgi:hypothetical protein
VALLCNVSRTLSRSGLWRTRAHKGRKVETAARKTKPRDVSRRLVPFAARTPALSASSEETCVRKRARAIPRLRTSRRLPVSRRTPFSGRRLIFALRRPRGLRQSAALLALEHHDNCRVLPVTIRGKRPERYRTAGKDLSAPFFRL